MQVAPELNYGLPAAPCFNHLLLSVVYASVIYIAPVFLPVLTYCLVIETSRCKKFAQGLPQQPSPKSRTPERESDFLHRYDE